MSELLGPDHDIESYLSQQIGCSFRYVEAFKIENVDLKSCRQVARFMMYDPNYIAGIKETMKCGSYIAPVILRQISAKRYAPLDGIHRVTAADQLGIETLTAYVVTDVSDIEADVIARTANVRLNGQGPSEEDRRRHFIEHLHQVYADFDDVDLRVDAVKRMMALLSIAQESARRWLDVEKVKLRAARLGLKLPPALGTAHRSGERTDAWLQSLKHFTDEELLKYWLELKDTTAAKAAAIARKLVKIQSTQARAEAAEQEIRALKLTVRATQIDVDRINANQIRSHGAGLLKVAPYFETLGAANGPVRDTLLRLWARLQEYVENTPDIDEDEHGTDEKRSPQAH